MTQKPVWWYTQSGALPFRRHAVFQESAGQLQILLITSRKRRRWIIPKGIVEPGLSPLASAAKEAFEEAGISGYIWPHSLGTYTRKKWQGICMIQVFPLEVTTILDTWPESEIRQRAWMSVEHAFETVEEPALKDMIRKLSEAIS